MFYGVNLMHPSGTSLIDERKTFKWVEATQQLEMNLQQLYSSMLI